MTIPAVDNIISTSSQYVNPYIYNNLGYSGLTSPLYSDSIWDMGSTMATGYNPMYDISMGYGYGISPYSMGDYSSGYGYYGMMSPAYAQALVKSQEIYMDGQAALQHKQREINYNGEVDTMNYDVKLSDAKNSHHEDITRRDTNINAIIRKINDRLEAQDTKGFRDAYNEGLSLYAKVYADVNNKRLAETPSASADIINAFQQKYADANGGKTLQQKVDETLPGAFSSGFKSIWRYQNVESAEEIKAMLDDRAIAYKAQEDTYKSFGKLIGGIANTAVCGVGGGIAFGAAGASVGAFLGKAGKFGKIGALIGTIGGLIFGAGRSITA